MKAHVIKLATIEDYVKSNTNSKKGFEFWIDMVKSAIWLNVNDIKNTFQSTDQIGNGSDRIVFNIGGNKYRMICSYHFGKRKVHLYINWIGTHAEYTKLCKKELQYTIDKY